MPILIGPLTIVESQHFRTFTRSHHSPASVQGLEQMPELQNQGHKEREKEIARVKNFQPQPTPASPFLPVLQPHFCLHCLLGKPPSSTLSAKGTQTHPCAQPKHQSPERPSLATPTIQLYVTFHFSLGFIPFRASTAICQYMSVSLSVSAYSL